jgi:hypothetical protein
MSLAYRRLADVRAQELPRAGDDVRDVAEFLVLPVGLAPDEGPRRLRTESQCLHCESLVRYPSSRSTRHGSLADFHLVSLVTMT